MTATATDPEAVAQATCDDLVVRMAPLRDIQRPAAEASANEVYVVLVDVRARLDLAETVLLEVTRFRSGSRSKAAQRKGEADDAYTEAMAKLAQQAVRRQYEGVEDRRAQANLQTLEVRRRARTAQRVADIADDCYERVRTLYFSLRDLRQELLDSLRYLEWETSMER